jgi:hypothetical protein
MDSLKRCLARSLIDIDSTTGREAEAGQWLAARLRTLGQRARTEDRAQLRPSWRQSMTRPGLFDALHCVLYTFPAASKMAG